MVPNHDPEYLFYRSVVLTQDCDLAPFFGDFSPSEKLYEIKPPLVSISVTRRNVLEMGMHVMHLAFFQ